MGLQEILILILIGIVAGFVSGTLGVGGAIIIVPALVLFLGMQQHHAQGTSLAVLLFPVGIFAVIQYNKSGFINYKFALVLILTFMLGSYIGSIFAIKLPEKVLNKAFGVLLFLVSLKILIGK
jgi:uncharacterized protein